MCLFVCQLVPQHHYLSLIHRENDKIYYYQSAYPCLSLFLFARFSLWRQQNYAVRIFQNLTKKDPSLIFLTPSLKCRVNIHMSIDSING